MTCERRVRAPSRLCTRTAVGRARAGCAFVLAWCAAAACQTHRDGTSIELLVASAAASSAAGTRGDLDAAAAGGHTLISDREYRVTLEHAYAVLGRVELVPCQEARLWPGLRELFGPATAYAHGISTPTVWAVPYVLDLLDARDRALSIARMRPPAGRYCAARVLIDIADADAENLPAGVPMVGRSIHLDGSFSAEGDGVQHAFRYETSVQAPVDLPFVDAAGTPLELALSSENLRAELRMELGFSELFDGLTMIAGDYEPHAVKVLDNVLAHARAVVRDD